MPTDAPSEGRFSIVKKVPFFYGWIILPVAAFALFMSGPGQTYTISIFVDPMIAELGWSRTIVSGLYTAGSLTAGAFMILAGRLLDRYGARIMLTAVAALFGLAALWMSQVNSQVELYLGLAALRALGQGAIGLFSTTLIATWFAEKRGKTVAVGAAGMACSQSIFPVVTQRLINSIGWRNTWATLGFSLWSLLLIPVAFFTRRSPESIGQLPDGIKKNTSGDIPGKQGKVAKIEASFTLQQARRTHAFWLLLISGISVPMLSTGLFFNHVSVMGSMGISPEIAASVYIVIGPLVLLGAFTSGFMADRVANRYLLAAVQLMIVGSMLWVFTISSTWQALIYGVLMGFTIGFSSNVNTVIWANYFGRRWLGSIRGVAVTCMVAASALGPLPFGYLFDRTGSYSLAILISLSLPLICLITSLMAKPPLVDMMDKDIYDSV